MKPALIILTILFLIYGIPMLYSLLTVAMAWRMNKKALDKSNRRCTQCGHRLATERNGLCGVCEWRNRHRDL